MERYTDKRKMTEPFGRNQAMKLMLEAYNKQTIRQGSYSLLDKLVIFKVWMKEVFGL